MRTHKILKHSLALILSSVLIYTSCKRTDLLQMKLSSDAIDNFFRVKPGTDPLVISIIQNIRKQNERRPFVNEFVGWAGFPLWEKAMVLKRNNSSSFARINTDDEFVYVPFSKVNQNSIGAILIAQIGSRDTVFKMVYNWQYEDYGFGPHSDTSWNARDVLHLFTMFEKEVYGHTLFKIKDYRLFGDRDDPRYIHTIRIRERHASRAIAIQECDIYDHCTYPAELEGAWCNGGNCTIGCEYWTHWTEECTTTWIEIGGGTGGGGGSGNPGSDPWSNPCRVVPGDDPCGGDNGWGYIYTQASLANDLNSILSPGDSYYFDNTLDQNNSLFFSSVGAFQNYLLINEANGQADLTQQPTIIDPNNKIEHGKFNLTGIGGVDVSVKLEKVGNVWTVNQVTSTEYGVTLGWSWEQSNYSQSTTGNEITVIVEGYVKYNIIIEQFGTVYKEFTKFRVKINNQTGKITSLAKL